MRRNFGIMMAAAMTLSPLAAGSALAGVNVESVLGSAVQMHVQSQADLVAADGGEVANGAKSFVVSMGEKGISFLGNEAFTQEQKEAEFRRMLKASFDMKTIGRFALGRYWSTATPEQQAEYLKLFETMVVNVYAARFNEYKGQTLDVTNARQDGDKDALVTSFIVDPNSGNKFQVDWRVRKKDGGYKIVDVIIEGVSMAVTQRSDFASVIQRGGGGVESILAHLRTKQ